MARPNRIWQRKNRGTWHVRIDGKLHNLGRDKEQAEKLFHKLKAADAPLPESVSVAAVLDKFLLWVQVNRAEGTFNTYRHVLQSFLDSLRNPSMEVTRLQPLHVTEWVNPDWSRSYQNSSITALQRAFKWAVVQGYIERSPIAVLEKPGAQRRDNCPTKNDFELMLHHASVEMKRVLEFVWESGSRPQEVGAIEGRHINGSRVEFPEKESKGRKYRRIIYLNDRARELLEGVTEGHAFTNRDGKPWTKDAINCAMCRISKKTGHKYALYDLRHAWVTRMLQTGLDHLTVAELAGHRDASMVARVYSHIGEKNDYLLEQLKRAS